MMKHFVLTRVGSLNPEVKDNYHKISSNFYAGNRSYDWDNCDYQETFMTKMLRKCSYDPSKSINAVSEEADLAREQYKNSILTRLANREIN